MSEAFDKCKKLKKWKLGANGKMGETTFTNAAVDDKNTGCKSMDIRETLYQTLPLKGFLTLEEEEDNDEKCVGPL